MQRLHNHCIMQFSKATQCNVSIEYIWNLCHSRSVAESNCTLHNLTWFPKCATYFEEHLNCYADSFPDVLKFCYGTFIQACCFALAMWLSHLGSMHGDISPKLNWIQLSEISCCDQGDWFIIGKKVLATWPSHLRSVICNFFIENIKLMLTQFDVCYETKNFFAPKSRCILVYRYI